MKVIILCGGKGTRLREETEYRPKPMIEIGGRPILWHIMKNYAHHGFDDFILCLGYKGEMIKQYFLNYHWLHTDFSIELGSQKVSALNGHTESKWRVTLMDTGLETMTGGRLKRVAGHIDSDTFMLTYGDGVTDLNIGELLRFHQKHGKLATVTGVSPPSRYGELGIEGDQVMSFREKPSAHASSISGGYFVFNRKFLDTLPSDDHCVLEREPLENLVGRGELKVFRHQGFWQCMDTARDYDFLKDLWSHGRPPWKVWNE